MVVPFVLIMQLPVLIEARAEDVAVAVAVVGVDEAVLTVEDEVVDVVSAVDVVVDEEVLEVAVVEGML
jgi:hypothetical protein